MDWFLCDTDLRHLKELIRLCSAKTEITGGAHFYFGSLRVAIENFTVINPKKLQKRLQKNFFFTIRVICQFIAFDSWFVVFFLENQR